MIKKYKEFINENNSYNGYNTIGEYIESIYDDENIQAMVSNKIEDIDTSVRISNAINVLSDYDKNKLLNQIEDYLNDINQKVEVDKDNISSTVEEVINENVEDNATIGGKNIFASFLKIITALGLKENKPDWKETPKDFIIYYKFNDIEYDRLLELVGRFQSLSHIFSQIKKTNNKCNLYFGINCDMMFEYGFITDKDNPIGKFKISKSTLKWLLDLKSPSVASLKRYIIDFDINTLIIFSKLKKEMYNYNPEKTEKQVSYIMNEGLPTYSIYGFGKWNNGVIDEEYFNKLKNNFKMWLSGFKWSNKLLVSINASNYWVNFKFKCK